MACCTIACRFPPLLEYPGPYKLEASWTRGSSIFRDFHCYCLNKKNAINMHICNVFENGFHIQTSNSCIIWPTIHLFLLTGNFAEVFQADCPGTLEGGRNELPAMRIWSPRSLLWLSGVLHWEDKVHRTEADSCGSSPLVTGLLSPTSPALTTSPLAPLHPPAGTGHTCCSANTPPLRTSICPLMLFPALGMPFS